MIDDGVEITTTLPESAVLVKADRPQIGQVIMNLAINVSDAMRSGGRLTIGVGVDPVRQEAVMTVSDEGAGDRRPVGRSDQRRQHTRGRERPFTITLASRQMRSGRVIAGAQAGEPWRRTDPGMDAETAAQIYEPFVTTKGDLGNGLGLSTVHGLQKPFSTDELDAKIRTLLDAIVV